MKLLTTFTTLFFSFLLLIPESYGQIPIRETAFFPDSVTLAGSAMLPDGRVMVWGGQKLAQTPSGKIWLSNKSYIYDPVQETWSAGADLNAEVVGPTVVTLQNGNIVSMGGQVYTTFFTVDSFPQRTHRVEMYDVSSQMWVDLDTIPFGSSPYTGISAIVTPAGNIFLTSTNGDYAMFNTNTMSWTPLTGTWGPLDAGGRPMVNLNNGKIFLTGAGGQLLDIAATSLTYLNPAQKLYTGEGAVVKMADGRILTWDNGSSFAQEAIIVSVDGTTATPTDSLLIPGQLTKGLLMPDDKVWMFGPGEVFTMTGKTLLQIFDPATDTWSSPGSYNIAPQLYVDYQLFLLNDSSIFVLNTTLPNCYRINAGSGSTGIQDQLEPLEWAISYDQQQKTLHLQSLATGQTEAVSLSIMDIQGKMLSWEKEVTGTHQVSLNSLSSGIYIARLLREDGAHLTKKIQVK